MMTDRKAYIERIKLKLDEWDRDIDRLQAKMRASEAQAALDYEVEIAKLRARRAEAEVKLVEARRASEAAWASLSQGFEAAWADISDGFRRAAARLA